MALHPTRKNLSIDNYLDFTLPDSIKGGLVMQITRESIFRLAGELMATQMSQMKAWVAQNGEEHFSMSRLEIFCVDSAFEIARIVDDRYDELIETDEIEAVDAAESEDDNVFT